MSLAVKPLWREILRLSLAAMLLLATFAGARMQGEMGAGMTLFAANGTMLCSGEAVPANSDQGSGDVHHAACTMCNLPIVDAPAVPVVVRNGVAWIALVHAALSTQSRSADIQTYSARGPPELA